MQDLCTHYNKTKFNYKERFLTMFEQDFGDAHKRKHVLDVDDINKNLGQKQLRTHII